MATSQDLMGLGIPPQLARLLGNSPVAVTAAGNTAAGATLIGNPDRKNVIVTGGTSAVAIGSVGADSGPLLGDMIYVANFSGADVTLFLRNSANLYTGGGTSVAGATGIVVTASCQAELNVISVSSFFVARVSI